MHINGKKSSLSTHLIEEEEVGYYKEYLPFESNPFDEGLKYLGFHQKPNRYKNKD